LRDKKRNENPEKVLKVRTEYGKSERKRERETNRQIDRMTKE
jgi:hypothetical protein